MLEDVFDACDDDGSGALSLDEFGQLFEQVDESTKAMFNEVDMETFDRADQKLTLAEFVAFHMRKFASLDDDTFETVVSQLLTIAENAEVIDDEAAVVGSKQSERERRTFGDDAPADGTAAQLLALLEGASTPGWTPTPLAPTIVSVLGAPGSGRSTQCASIASLINGTCLSASEAMSAAVSVGTPVGEKVSLVLSQGKAITHELYAELLKEAMGVSSGPFVLDGWPEDSAGVEALEEAGVRITVAIALDLPLSTRTDRINERSEMSGWDFFSDEEREASDGELATRCKAYDARWATLSSQLTDACTLCRIPASSRSVVSFAAISSALLGASVLASCFTFQSDSSMVPIPDHADKGTSQPLSAAPSTIVASLEPLAAQAASCASFKPLPELALPLPPAQQPPAMGLGSTPVTVASAPGPALAAVPVQAAVPIPPPVQKVHVTPPVAAPPAASAAAPKGRVLIANDRSGPLKASKPVGDKDTTKKPSRDPIKGSASVEAMKREAATERAAKEAAQAEAAEAKAAAEHAKADAKAAWKEAESAKQAAQKAMEAAQSIAVPSSLQANRSPRAPSSPVPSISSPRRAMAAQDFPNHQTFAPSSDDMATSKDVSSATIASLTRRAEDAERVAAEAQRQAQMANACVANGMNTLKKEMQSWVDEHLALSPRPHAHGYVESPEQILASHAAVPDAFARTMDRLEQKLVRGEMLTWDEQMALMSAARQSHQRGGSGGALVSESGSIMSSMQVQPIQQSIGVDGVSTRTLHLMDNLDGYSASTRSGVQSARRSRQLPGIADGPLGGGPRRPATGTLAARADASRTRPSTSSASPRPRPHHHAPSSARRHGSPSRHDPNLRLVSSWDVKARIYDPYWGGATPPWMV